jgi:predicted Zn finger-like uncharacterized protein
MDDFEKPDDGGGDALDQRECPHCLLWFRMDDAKPLLSGKGVRCPNCDWHLAST